jgi:hypothetical protein
VFHFGAVVKKWNTVFAARIDEGAAMEQPVAPSDTEENMAKKKTFITN